MDSLIEAADKAMYIEKEANRRRVKIQKDEELAKQLGVVELQPDSYSIIENVEVEELTNAIN